MILIPRDLHEAYRHSGGASLIDNGAILYTQGTVPQKAIAMAEKIKINNGNKIDGYEGGGIWMNIPVGKGDQMLSEGVIIHQFCQCMVLI